MRDAGYPEQNQTHFPRENTLKARNTLNNDSGPKADLKGPQHPAVVAGMKRQYECWYEDVTTNPGFTRPRAILEVGHDQQKHVRVSMYGGKAVRIVHPGPYRITLQPSGTVKWKRGDVWNGRPFVADAPGAAGFRIGDVSMRKTIAKGQKQCVFDAVTLPVGQGNFRLTFAVDGKPVFGGKNAAGHSLGPVHVTFERIQRR